MADADESTLHYLRCPVCSELPEGHVYQCWNGHTICDNCCSSGVLKCPHCQVPFENEKIRNRVVEDMLQRLELTCIYRREGCRAKLCAKDLDKHTEICNFGPLNICRLLHFNDKCGFESSNPSLVFKHFVDNHKIKPFKGKECRWTFHKVNRELGNLIPESNWKAQVFPWEVDFKVTKSMFILCKVVSRRRSGAGHIDFFCLYIGDSLDDELFTNIQIEVNIPDCDYSWIWKGNPTHFRKLKMLIQDPPLSIPIGYLNHQSEKQLKDFDIELTASVSQ